MSGPPADGLLLVDKPSGVTSHDVVDVARRALGERRIGHAGTLDPFATGLLVLLVGRATRLMPYVDGEPKVYEATIQFGAETDTDDPTGAVTTTAPLPQHAAVGRAIAALTGTIEQMPPAYSAKQVGGRRAYAAARQGERLALSPVRVAVHDWSVRALGPDRAHVTVTCSGGTYVRALARDLGRLAGSAAHLTALRRTRSGPFDVADAVPLDALRGGAATLRPPLDALRTLVVDTLDESGAARVRRGMPVPASAPGACGALVDESHALGDGDERVGDQWQPRVVLRDA
jgi:tRNA pseudouridine55 synthase